MSLLTVSHLSAGYGRKEILHDISFTSRPGTITGILGANGCGKTTLLKAIAIQRRHLHDIRFNR